MTAKLCLGFALSLALVAVPAPAFADTVNLGKHASGEIRDKCNAVGGDLIGSPDSATGSYGCDNGKNGGGMVLCNKNQQCTGYTAARTRADIGRIASKLHLKVNSRK